MMDKDIVQVAPERFTAAITETAKMLLDFFEEKGYHQQEEVTTFLMLLSSLDYIDSSFLVDFAQYTKREG